METFTTAFLAGGLGMYPILATGLILVVAAIRYAIDGETIRLRFVFHLSLANLAMMFFFGVYGVVFALKGMAAAAQAERDAGLAAGLSITINVWALGLLSFALAFTAVAVGTYRVGRRQLEALKS
jgi:hypothetical protein